MFNQSIIEMLEKYKLNTVQDHENALKEIIQKVALLGLWRGKFFEHGLFYGGSALRILYNLDRFSEDLDFSLIKPEPNFTLNHYLKYLKTELSSLGFKIELEYKEKPQYKQIDSAFIKANTLLHLLKINTELSTHKNAILNIKLEVDLDPPIGFTTEVKYHLNPLPFSIKTMSLPDLFAGKLHAALFRKRTFNIKGRDWYDLVWFLKKNVPINTKHLKQRMIQTGNISKHDTIDKKKLLYLIKEKTTAIDFETAKKDVIPFLKNELSLASLSLWSGDYFNTIFQESLEILTEKV